METEGLLTTDSAACAAAYEPVEAFLPCCSCCCCAVGFSAPGVLAAEVCVCWSWPCLNAGACTGTPAVGWPMAAAAARGEPCCSAGAALRRNSRVTGAGDVIDGGPCDVTGDIITGMGLEGSAASMLALAASPATLARAELPFLSGNAGVSATPRTAIMLTSANLPGLTSAVPAAGPAAGSLPGGLAGGTTAMLWFRLVVSVGAPRCCCCCCCSGDAAGTASMLKLSP